MKNEIKELNLIYGVCANDIISQYSEFKTFKGKKLKEISNQINEYFLWLEQQKNINALNIVLVGKELLKKREIRKCILENDIALLQETSLELLKKIKIKNINNKLTKDEYLYIDYSSSEDIDLRSLQVEQFVINSLESSNLLFKDLIQLLLDNYDFSKHFKRAFFSSGYYLNFLSKLNYIYYHLANFLNSSRENIYYASLWLLQYPNISEVLFPRSYYPTFNKKDSNYVSSKLVELGIIRALHNINLYYYIEIKDFNYKNTQTNISYRNKNEDREDTLFQYITSVLTLKDKIFLYKIAFIDRKQAFSSQDMKELQDLISSLKKLDNIIIIPQDLSSERQKLLEDTINYIQEYSKKHNIKLQNFVYCPKPVRDTNMLYLEFYIIHDKFKYRNCIRKYNAVLTWSIYLKNSKVYKINLYSPEDFKHILLAIYNDYKNI